MGQVETKSDMLKRAARAGDLDLVVGNFFGATRLYLNNGRGGFGSGSDISSDLLGTLALAVDDIDKDGDMDVIAANSKPALGAAGAGSAFDVGGDVRAYVASGATVTTSRSLFVTAHDETRVATIARSDAENGAAAAALAAVSPDIVRRVAAYVDGKVTVAAGSGLDARQGMFIDASAHDDLLGYATGRASSRELGLAASVVIFRMESDVESYIGAGASVTATNATAGVPISVIVMATHTSDVLGLAGSFGGSPFAGIGAALSANLWTKHVKAHIDPAATIDSVDYPAASVRARDDVLVKAVSTENLDSVAAGRTGGFALGVAGSVSFAKLDKFTWASIEGATVFADGNVLLEADSDVDFDARAGSLVSGAVDGIGIAAAVLMDRMAANACGLRTNAACVVPGITMSSV